MRSEPNRIIISGSAAKSVRKGHPWIWRDAVRTSSVLARLTSGDEVVVYDDGGEFLGRGIYDADSLVRVRVWDHSARECEFGELFESRLAAAEVLRGRLFADGETTAYRLVNGEGDRMPGIVIDRYADVAVMRTDGLGARTVASRAIDTVWSRLNDIGITTLLEKRTARDEGKARFVLVRGNAVERPVEVCEHGMPFYVDLTQGQKTGAFLDQRANRLRVRHLARGRTVLNLFSYTGGFSLAALCGGAKHAVNVDVAKRAHLSAAESMALSGFGEDQIEFVADAVADFLGEARRSGRKWDLIISDPPSFVSSEKALKAGLKAYRQLHRACLEVLAPQGILCASSCSSHVDAKTFLSTLDLRATGAREMRIVGIYGLPEDHPVVPAWVEGQYLKFVVLT